MKEFALIVALFMAFALAGCGDESSIETQSGAEAAKRPEPDVSLPKGAPPATLTVEDLILGSGDVAQRGDELAVHFVAVRVDGEPFESIWESPFSFELSPKAVNPGWVRGLHGMRVGGRRKLIVPTELTSRYALSPSENDPQNSLVYVIDLLDVRSGDSKAGETARRSEPEVSLPAGPPPGRLVVGDLIEGSGGAAKVGDELTVEYLGVRFDGTMFARSSWKRKEPFSFRLGSDDIRVNPAWEKGLVGMREGGRRELIVPPGLLGGKTSLPENSPEGTVVYVIDLIDLE